MGIEIGDCFAIVDDEGSYEVVGVDGDEVELCGDIGEKFWIRAVELEDPERWVRVVVYDARPRRDQLAAGIAAASREAAGEAHDARKTLTECGSDIRADVARAEAELLASLLATSAPAERIRVSAVTLAAAALLIAAVDGVAS